MGGVCVLIVLGRSRKTNSLTGIWQGFHPAKKKSCCQKQQEKAQSKRGNPNGSPLSDSFREGLHRSNHL